MTPWLRDPEVAVVHGDADYARTPPFPPSEAYPEAHGVAPGREDNPAYRAVREALRALGLDAGRFGSPSWNPLGELVKPGETVVLKPNFVSHRNMGERHLGITDTDCLVTHGSFVRAVLDYAARGLEGRGRVIVGDCPVQGTSWERLGALVGLEAVLEDARARFQGIEFTARDYRLTKARVTAGGQVLARESREPDEGYEEVDLGSSSLLLPLMREPFSFGVAQYPRNRMRRAHGPGSNRYLVPRDFLDADLFINLPKMKSHQKAGVTCALKNLVGINGHKDYLPHFRFGSPKNGGDEHPDGGLLWDLYWRFVHAEWDHDRGPLKLLFQASAFACSQLMRRAGRVVRSEILQGGGSWHGNDTLWRTVLDINRAFLYYGREGRAVRPGTPRQYLALLDGLVGGHRESPLAPSPIRSGLVLAARNPVALDTVAVALMGLDWRRLPQIARAYDAMEYPLAAFAPEEIVLRGWPGFSRVEDIYRERAFVPFEPSHGWRGHVEYGSSAPPDEPAPAPGRRSPSPQAAR